MKKRVCFNCNKHLPPETEHFEIRDEVYCKDCVEVKPYTAYQFYIAGDYVADSEHDDAKLVEDYEDEYEEDEQQCQKDNFYEEHSPKTSDFI